MQDGQTPALPDSEWHGSSYDSRGKGALTSEYRDILSAFCRVDYNGTACNSTTVSDLGNYQESFPGTSQTIINTRDSAPGTSSLDPLTAGCVTGAVHLEELPPECFL
jgi:hypothetical protein